MTTPVRRSGRKRTTNQNYANTNWDEIIQDLDQSSESDREPRKRISDSADVSADAEYIDPLDDSQPGAEDVQSEADSVVSTIDANRDNDGDGDSGDARSKLVSKVAIKRKPTTSKAKNTKRMRWKVTPEGHSRGLSNIDRKAGKVSIYQDTFGPSASDITHILQTRNLWGLRARDVTLPSRRTLEEAFESQWHKHTARIDQTKQPGPSKSSKILRTTVSVSASEMKRFLPNSIAQTVVLGTQEAQRPYELEFLQSIDFGTAREHRKGGESTNTVTLNENGLSTAGLEGPIHAARPQRLSIDKFQEGWLLNAGETIKSLTWKPYDGNGIHYLAVGCRSPFMSQESSQPPNQIKSEAFSSSPSYPSSIQIWQIASVKSGGNTETLNYESKPFVCRIIATEYGQIRQLAWLLPTPDSGIEPSTTVDNLVCLSSDGCVRIIEVPRLWDQQLPSKNVGTPATAKCCISPPKGSIFTTFTFASPNEIIVGGSDGYVRIYDLAESAIAGDLRPYLSLQIHHTYVLGLCTAGHAERSHFLASTSAAGDLKLTDLRSPHQDRVAVARTRLPSNLLVYCPLTQSFITTVDYSGRTETFAARTTVAAHQLRHFYSKVILTKFPNSAGTASALAGSKYHPYILVGNTQGTVLCQNILRKLLPRSGGWVQKLCEYEWIPADKKDENNNTNSTNPLEQRPEGAQNEAVSGLLPPSSIAQSTPVDLSSASSITNRTSSYYGHGVRRGISRFIQGFPLEKPDLAPGVGHPVRQNAKDVDKKNGKGKSASKPKTKGKNKKSKIQGDTVADFESVAVDDDDAIANGDDNDEDDDEDDNSNHDDDDEDEEEGNHDQPADEEVDNGEELEASSSKATGMSTDDVIVAEVIYEEEQAVTAMAWNEDPRCASWAAIGWGSGIIRIQDLSYDTD